MSASLADVTLTLNSAATLPINNVPLSYIKWLVLLNTSPYACHAALGGYTFTIPAWYYYPVAVRDDNGNLKPGVSLPFSITPYLQTIPGAGFTSILHTELYMVGEDPPQTVPMPLGGGPVDLTIASEIISTNQPPAQTIVFAAPLNDTNAAGASNLNNQGQLVLGDSLYNGSIAILGKDSAQMAITRNGIQAISAAALQVLNWQTATGILQLGDGFNIPGELQLFSTADSIDIDLKPGATTLNGSTSGTATMWEPFIGNGLRFVLVNYNNFRNGGASLQTLTFPTAFTTFQCIITSNIPTGVALGSAGAGVNVGQMIFSTVGGTSGTESSQANLVQNEVASHLGAADSLRHASGQAAAWSGWLLIIGV